MTSPRADLDHNSAQPTTMVLRAEQVHTRAERVPSERVTLRRKVVTELRTITIAVRREVAEVVREPVVDDHSESLGRAQNSAGSALADPEPVLVLHEERPVIGFEVVETERVWLRREVHDEQIDVTLAVAHEEVDVSH